MRWEYCDDFRPQIDSPFPTFEAKGRLQLAAGLAYGAIVVLALIWFRTVPRVEVSLVMFGLGAGALICAFWEPLARFLTNDGEGEPIAFLQGISVWPTVLLRSLGIILAVYFVWRAQRNLRNNLAEIASEMDLDPSYTPEPLWKKITHLFNFSPRSYRESDQTSQSSYRLQVEVIWKAYVGQERLWNRLLRATFYAILMSAILSIVLVPLFGSSSIPARGDVARMAYYLTTREEVTLTLFLAFFIFDATFCCLHFVNKLRHAQTEWPRETVDAYKERLRLQTEFVNDWIDLEFVAKRTSCIASLIYYPFVLIALFIMAGSTMFANYAPSLTVLVALAFSFGIVVGCAVALWRASETLRATARENLTDAINFAKADCANIDDAAGEAERKDLRDKTRYGAQLENLLSKVNQLKDGAFSSLFQQPLVRAALWPLSAIAAPLLVDLAEQLIKNGMISGP